MPKQHSPWLIVNSLWSKKFKAKSHKLHATSQSGFSLIEIILALFLILTIVGILLSTSGSLFTTRSSRLQTQAGRIATKDIENLRKGDFSAIASGSITDADLAKLPTGQASRSVLDYGDPPNPKIKQVTITVSWVDNNVTKTYTTDTLIYEKGL